MKLLHITATHLEKYGGIPAVLYDLIREQNSIPGFESRLLAIKAKYSGYDSQYFDFLQNNQSFEEYLNWYRPDIVILHSFFYLDYAKVSRVLRRKNIHYYIEPHGSFGKQANKKSKLKKIISYKTIFKNLIKGADGFVFLNSEEMEDSIFRKHKDIIIPNGVNAHELVKKTSDKPTFYYIGRYDINHKGLDYLVCALQILDKEGKDYRVDFYGIGDDEQEKFLKEELKKLNNIKACDHGPIYGSQKDEMLKKAGIMLLTSRYEGFPMTVLEALSNGNPCIVTPMANVTRIIKDNKLGWITELKATDIAETINTAYSQYIDKKNLPLMCQKFVLENYLWSDIAQKSYDLLKKSLAEK